MIHIVSGTDFEYLPENLQRNIRKLETFDTLDSTKIYELTGNQLMKELQSHEKSLVYLFRSSCSSENCVPLKIIEEYATKNDYTLFLVLTTYADLEKTIAQNIHSQLFSINTDYYKRSKSRNYIPAFEADLGNDKSKNLGSVFIFHRSTLTEVKTSVLEQ